MSDVIDSLEWAKQALSRTPEEGPSRDLSELIFQIKMAREDYRCAIQTLDPYKKSTDELVKASAIVLQGAYTLVIAADERIVSEVVRMLDEAATGKIPTEGRMISAFTDLRVQKAEALKTVPVAAIGTTYALVQLGHKGEPTGRFRITKEQRRALLRELERRFGSSVQVGMQAGQAAFDAAAGALYGVLADPQWRSLDD